MIKNLHSVSEFKAPGAD